MLIGFRCEMCGYLCTLPLGSASTSFHVDCRLIRVQDTFNKSTKLAMGRCHEHDGPLTDQSAIALSWTVVNSRRTMMAVPCSAIQYALRWGDTCMWTTVAASRMIIPKSHISTREFFQTLTKIRTGLHTAFTGDGWVSLSRELCLCSPTHVMLRFQR